MSGEVPVWLQLLEVLLPVFGPLGLLTFLVWLASGGSLKQPRCREDWVGDPEFAQRVARRSGR